MLQSKANDFLAADLDFNYSQKITITSTNRIQQRSQIAVLNQLGVTKQMIAWFVNRNVSTINRWISRFADARELYDQKRSGRPLRIMEDVQLKTVAFYCQTTPLPGLSRLSLRDAAKYLAQHQEILGCSISYSTIGRFLKNHSLRPHLNKYFLNITDPHFFPKMQHLINLYLNQPEYLFCYDECPGIQALMPICPDLLFDEDLPNYRDFLYTRNGTIDLMAFLRVKNGKVFGVCNSNHNRHTFISIFKQQVTMQPADVQLHYVMDNLNTHFHHDFCKAVAQLSNVKYSPLEKGSQPREWLQKNDKRIVIHFTPFHGSWLNMVEIWFGILNQKYIKHGFFYNVETLQNTILDFIDTWNRYFAHPFTWNYKGDGLYEKAISRFNKLLLIETPQMDISFLNKQLLLMANIAKDSHNILKTEQWLQLRELLMLKEDYLQNVIINLPKERKKKIIWQSLENLKKIMNC